MLKARCIESCNSIVGIFGSSSIGCCSSFFQVGELYEVRLDGGVTVNSHGEVSLWFEAEVMTGEVDGWDAPCGARFHNPCYLNDYFQIVEEE